MRRPTPPDDRVTAIMAPITDDPATAGMRDPIDEVKAVLDGGPTAASRTAAMMSPAASPTKPSTPPPAPPSPPAAHGGGDDGDDVEEPALLHRVFGGWGVRRWLKYWHP